ncbi:hypothetical protein EON64_14585, partial [archaeon]
LYHELAFTSKEFMRTVAPIQPAWLLEAAPHFYKHNDLHDEAAQKLRGRGKAQASERD